MKAARRSQSSAPGGAASTFHISGQGGSDQSGASSATMDATINGEVDVRSHRLKLTETPLASTGGTTSAGSSPTYVPSATSPRTTIEVGRDVWVSGALLGVAANQWIHAVLPPSEASQPVTGGIFANPSALFDQMKKHTNGIAYMGTATIGGTPTKAYRASYSQTISPDLKVSYTLEVWVDDAALVRQLRLTVSTPENSTSDGAAAGTSMVTLDFTDYGQPVNIQPPPPVDVVPSSSGLLLPNSTSASSVR